MDKNLAAITKGRMERAAEALRQNHMDAHIVSGIEELHRKLAGLMKEGATWSVGGSITLFETGVIDYLKQGPYTYFDRYAEGADLGDVFAKARNCDFYFCSSNAITEDGKLYNVDGRGNRISNLIDGPKQVVIIAGCNKLVRDVESARRRVEEIAAPANACRLGLESPDPICCHELVSQQQQQQGRIIIFLLPESYGY